MEKKFPVANKVKERVNTRKNLKKPSGLTAPKKLKTLLLVVDRRKTDLYVSLLQRYDANLQFVLYANGTHSYSIDKKEISKENLQKVVIIAIIQESRVKDILNTLETHYFKQKNGRGIACIIPISSVIGVKTYKFLANIKEDLQ